MHGPSLLTCYPTTMNFNCCVCVPSIYAIGLFGQVPNELFASSDLRL